MQHTIRQSLEQTGTRFWTLAGHWPAVGAILFGVTILYFIGLSNFPQAHNAAHDTRHASGFPCH
jgi:cobalt transporter subunit CbtB